MDVPTDTPHGSTALLSVRVSDSKGQFSAPVARSYTIRDNQGPQIEVISPAPNSVFEPGEEREVVFRVRDPSGVSEFRSNGGQSITLLSISAVDADGFVNARIRMTTVGDIDGSLIMLARDTLGNASNLVVRLSTRDNVPPSIASVRLRGHPYRDGLPDQIVSIKFDEPVKASTVFGNITFTKDFGWFCREL